MDHPEVSFGMKHVVLERSLEVLNTVVLQAQKKEKFSEESFLYRRISQRSMVRLLIFFALSLNFQVVAAESLVFTQELIPFENIFKVISKDIARIEVYYPKQFERLEMDWESNEKAYEKAFITEKNIEKKIHILSRYINSWHNAHHKLLSVKGIAHKTPETELGLPLKIFIQGIKLSEAKVFLLEKDERNSNLANIKVGAEILEFDGKLVADYISWVRDEYNSESPESILNSMAQAMTRQKTCRWGRRQCWQDGDSIKIVFKQGAEKIEKTLIWQDYSTFKFAPSSTVPIFPEYLSNWQFKTLYDQYGYGYDDVPNFGFFGELTNGSEVYLVYKQFLFRDRALIDSFINNIHKKKYSGIILDFQENYGGNDTAFALLAGLLGDQFHLEISSMKLVPELLNDNLMSDSAVYSGNSKFFKNLMADSRNLNLMSPFVPFRCIDETCELKTKYEFYKSSFPVSPIVPKDPLKNLALITGRDTVSKSDSINVLFHAHNIGPVVGTPAVASSGRYYFQKEYYTSVGKNVVTLSVTFTPDFSLAGDCAEVQGNPPEPHQLIKRTIENYRYYDTLLWVKAAKAIQKWDYSKLNLSRNCSLDQAKMLLKRKNLTQAMKGNK